MRRAASHRRCTCLSSASQYVERRVASASQARLEHWPHVEHHLPLVTSISKTTSHRGGLSLRLISRIFNRCPTSAPYDRPGVLTKNASAFAQIRLSASGTLPAMPPRLASTSGDVRSVRMKVLGSPSVEEGAFDPGVVAKKVGEAPRRWVFVVDIVGVDDRAETVGGRWTR